MIRTLPPTLALLLSILISGCRTPDAASFSAVTSGMSKNQVLDLLGPPSTRWTAPPPDPTRPRVHWSERWHYGDTLSTTASTALAPEIAPDGVWVVSFGESGEVLDARPPRVPQRTDPRQPPPK